MKKRRIKPLICIFCEGKESEFAYSKFLKKHYQNKVRIGKIEHGFFSDAWKKFKRDKWYKKNVKSIDEVWFFFDVDKTTEYNGSFNSWKEHIKSELDKFEKSRDCKHIKIRMLMTTGCIEYWFLLHFGKTYPSITTVAEKNQILDRLRKKVPGYKKNNHDKILELAEKHYKKAIENGSWVIKRIEKNGLPQEDGIARYRFLYTCGETFTNVQDTLIYLDNFDRLSC